MPNLKDGTYVLELAMFKGNQKVRTSKQTFNRKVFPWENNQLGITDKVYAPFRDLKVSGNKLNSVMTEFSFDKTGLYSSVKPDGQEILKEKLSYHFRANDAAGKIIKAGGKFIKKTAAECVFEGTAATNAGFSIKTVAKTEYDGCTRYEMTLAPEKGKTPVLNNLYLDIPLDDSQIRLLHVIKSGHIRTNPAIYVPKGNGVVWKSTEVSNGAESSIAFNAVNGIMVKLKSTLIKNELFFQVSIQINQFYESNSIFQTIFFAHHQFSVIKDQLVRQI